MTWWSSWGRLHDALPEPHPVRASHNLSQRATECGAAKAAQQ